MTHMAEMWLARDESTDAVSATWPSRFSHPVPWHTGCEMRMKDLSPLVCVPCIFCGIDAGIAF